MQSLPTSFGKQKTVELISFDRFKRATAKETDLPTTHQANIKAHTKVHCC